MKAQQPGILSPQQQIDECAANTPGGANWFNTTNCFMMFYFGEGLDFIGDLSAYEAHKLWAWATDQPGYAFDIRSYDPDGMDDYGW